jgi:xanthine dehydrogenase FAD-binding subunit
MGTIGGNAVTASPAGDTLPALYVCGGRVEIMGQSSSRCVPISDNSSGPGWTGLGPGELVTALVTPKADRFTTHHFEKVGRRKGNALAIAVVSLAAMLWVEPDGIVAEARLAWGSVGPTVIRDATIEALLVGRPLGPRC